MDVVLMVNSACNIRCKHCYQSYSGQIEPAKALEMVKKLQAMGYGVIIAGSETLLNPEYLGVYQAAGMGHILSNGIVLDQDKSLYEKLKKHGITGIRLSLHFGIDDCLKSVPEELVARVITACRRRGFGVDIATVLSSENYHLVEEMCDRAVEYGASEISFGRLIVMGRAKQLAQSALTPEQILKVFEQVTMVRGRIPKSLLRINLVGNFGPRPGSPGEEMARKNRYCPAGRKLVAIDPQGTVYGCPFCMRPEGIIGRYEDGEIIITRDLCGGRRDTCIAHLL